MIFKLDSVLGHGAYGIVFKAIPQEPHDFTRLVAVKKSRVSLRVQRTLLKHESRIIQLLQGHPAIPAVYAYGRFEHFEYMAMEQLGSTVKDLHQRPRALPLKTVLLIADQMLSALHHLRGHGIVHRDIKPDNMLLSLDDPNTLRLIDFGISHHYGTGIPRRRDPHIGGRHIMGTLDWASLNAHYGIDLSSRDDAESLAYTLLYLLRGDLPWRKGPNDDTILESMMQVRECKRSWSGENLAEGHAEEFGKLLDHARGLGYNDAPDYVHFRQLFQALYKRSGFGEDTTFDWSAVDVPASIRRETSPHAEKLPLPPDGSTDESLPTSHEESDSDDDMTNSYYGWDIADWDDAQQERDRSLTLPEKEKELLDAQIPVISQIL